MKIIALLFVLTSCASINESYLEKRLAEYCMKRTIFNKYDAVTMEHKEIKSCLESSEHTFDFSDKDSILSDKELEK